MNEPEPEPDMPPQQGKQPQKYAERFPGGHAPAMDEDFQPADSDNPTVELFTAIVNAIGQMPRIPESGGEPGGGIKYKFLSEKEILPAVAPIMVLNGLFIYPHRQIRVSEFRGGKMTTRFIGTRYRLCHVSGGYIHIETFGEGFDAGDKSCYKAMTGAYKYAIRQTFMLSGGDDPDNTLSDGSGGGQNRQNRPAGNQNRGGNPPPRFDPKILPPELRFKLYRDSLATAATVAEVEKTIGAARRVVQFTAEQKSALESTALSTATALSQHHANSPAIPAGDGEPAM